VNEDECAKNKNNGGSTTKNAGDGKTLNAVGNGNNGGDDCVYHYGKAWKKKGILEKIVNN
jgi:hypothetical protein